MVSVAAAGVPSVAPRNGCVSVRVTVSSDSSVGSFTISTFTVFVISPSANSTVEEKPMKSAGVAAVPAAAVNLTVIGPDEPASRTSVIERAAGAFEHAVGPRPGNARGRDAPPRDRG